MDGQRHDVSPLADVEAAPGELEPAQGWGREDLTERASRSVGACDEVREPRSQDAPAGDPPVEGRS
jgi:hypothetical protein